MMNPIQNLIDRTKAVRTALGGAALGMIMLPIGAAADMETVTRSELEGFEDIPDSGYMEFYQHPDLASFRFSSIYIAPVANEMPERLIYEFRWRPYVVDELAEDYHARLVTAFENTGLLVDEPDENSLIISPSIVFVTKYDERDTGSHLNGAAARYRIRGNTIMEMTWQAGPEGPMIAAIRDGRTPYVYAPVSDREDRFTDARDTFTVWALELASFFGGTSETEIN